MKVFYYYCNKAGTYKSEGTGKQQLKTQGTAKMGSQCSAYIKAVQDEDTNFIVPITLYTTITQHK